ncbi:calpain-B-like isoform X3 [Chrysoperla carnea]|uniref:calpain-B-like isoform X3 n=1 Tax=Chrysoperla carnea TaxID=189513 RepID=UPI001D08A1FC|nr:calpain-B-like isoform X3 [Chrysoperla carnea]
MNLQYGWVNLPPAPANSYAWHGHGYGWMLDPSKWTVPDPNAYTKHGYNHNGPAEPVPIIEEAPIAKTEVKSVEQIYQQGGAAEAKSLTQDFHQLRDECLRRNILFEDPEFPPTDSSLYFSKRPDRYFEWKRPSEIADDPALFVEGFSRFDVQQGELGDCWLLAAVANLTLSRKLFFQIVPDDQDFQENYAGIFHFRFWQYGKWVDVVIDDRLPTYRGQLIFLHSAEPNEFWSALLEKAYAKLHGSYEALKGGSTCEAMEDFTGGVTEMYDLHESPPNLFKILLKAYERNSLMGCSIEPDPNVLEAETSQGLIRGHAYSITRVSYVDIETPNTVGKIPLIRLRNPWGNEAEWNGPWSDKSPEWRFIPEHVKEELGLTFDDDGEFWMSYKDFQKFFDRLEICNLSPDSLTEEDVELGKKKWEMSVFEGDWVRGVTAGGCRNYLETFSHNPQYRITLTEVDDDDDENKCTVIVALMQKNRRALRNRGEDCLTIGFAIYYLSNPDILPKPLDINFFKYNASVARSPSFINLREVSCRFKLPPGTYCIVPSTFEPNEEAEFLLRVFSENKNNMVENDEEVGTCDIDDRVVDDDPEPTPQVHDQVREFFLKLAGEDGEVDWRELKEILDYVMRNELPAYKENATGAMAENGENTDCASLLLSLLSAICSVACKDTPLADTFQQQPANNPNQVPDGIIETHNRGFSQQLCQSMIHMMDKDYNGKLNFEEFKALWVDVRNWKNVFKLYDRNFTGFLSAFELRQALNSAGFTVNNHLLGTLVQRYGTREGYIPFDGFLACAVKLKTMIKNPDEYNRFMNEGMPLSYAGYPGYPSYPGGFTQGGY